MREEVLCPGSCIVIRSSNSGGMPTVTTYMSSQSMDLDCMTKTDLYQLITAMCYRSTEIAMTPTVAALLKKLQEDVTTQRVAMKLEGI